MKKCLAVLLLCAISISLSACGLLSLSLLEKQEEPLSTEPAPDESSEPEKKPPETSEPVTEETEPKSPFLGVTDAYYDFRTQDLYGECFHCYHIPRMDFEGELQAGGNETIYSELYAVLEKQLYTDAEYYELGELSYTWGQDNGIVSIVAKTSMISYDNTNYYIYNASAETGEIVTAQEVLAAYGMTEAEYEELLKESIVKYFSDRAETVIEFTSEAEYQNILNQSLAEATIGSTTPFVGSNGALCAKATVYWIAGAGRYSMLFDLETNQLLPASACTGKHPT